jgi:hypothetical protein
MEPIVKCPHCDEFVIIEKLNCGIFRHGIIKSTLKQMEPHLPKDKCDQLKERNLIFGCGKPFQILHLLTFQTPIIYRQFYK